VIAFNRFWAMPSADTLTISEIKGWVQKFLLKSSVSVDPFARNCRMAKYRNDLNPETAADYHMDALDFLLLLKKQGVEPDLCIFDPPYSRQQVKQVYDGIGRHYGLKDTQDHSTNWRAERDAVDEIITDGGIVLSFGWNSAGMGKERGYEVEDILLIYHGGAHNDTICIAERKTPRELGLFGCSRKVL
jgi:spermidine/putrescine-binding protein